MDFKLYCSSCGKQNETNAVFCSSCGVKIHDSVSKSNETSIPVGKKQELFQKNEVKEHRLASISDRFVALLIDYIFMGLMLGIGWVIWWLLILHRGQTPGKQLVGIYTAFVSSPEIPVAWGYGFFKDLFFKLGFIYWIPFAIFANVLLEFIEFDDPISVIPVWILILIDHFWSLWDKSGNKQTLHDKIFKTSVYYKNK